MTTANVKTRPRPFLFPHLCKACGRCIEACPKGCIHPGAEIDPASGFAPVTIDLDGCNACGLCFAACPEPHGLLPLPAGADAGFDPESWTPEAYFGTRASTAPRSSCCSSDAISGSSQGESSKPQSSATVG